MYIYLYVCICISYYAFTVEIPITGAYALAMGKEPNWTTWKKRTGRGKQGEVIYYNRLWYKGVCPEHFYANVRS